jgi:hypothetical protein
VRAVLAPHPVGGRIRMAPGYEVNRYVLEFLDSKHLVCLQNALQAVVGEIFRQTQNTKSPTYSNFYKRFYFHGLVLEQALRCGSVFNISFESIRSSVPPSARVFDRTWPC